MLNREAILREVLAMRDRADQIVRALGGEGFTGELRPGMRVWYDFGGSLVKVTVGEYYEKTAWSNEPTRWGYAPPPFYQFHASEEDFRHHIISAEAMASPVETKDGRP